MVDNYAVASIIVRLMASVFLMMVFRRQIEECSRNKGALRRFKLLLMLAVIILFVSNMTTIGVNFFRQSDGNLIEDIRHANQIFNAVAGLAISGIMYLIYNYHEDK